MKSEEVIKIYISKRSDFYKLYFNIEKRISNKTIEIYLEDFFFEPLDILVLTKFIIFQKKQQCLIYVQSEGKLRDYFLAIDLAGFCKTNYEAPKTITSIKSYTAMPIRRIERDTMVQYIDATERYFRLVCPNKDLTMLNLSIAELVNNVYDHAHSPIDAYVFCQYYHKTDIIKVAVSDLGKGIPKSVNQYKLDKGEVRLTDVKCVQWALEENKTVKSMPYNAGKGLNTINHFIKANKGSWKLFSGDVLMNGYPSRNSYENNPIYNFSGTVIQINISVKNLPELEFVETDEWSW